MYCDTCAYRQRSSNNHNQDNHNHKNNHDRHSHSHSHNNNHNHRHYHSHRHDTVVDRSGRAYHREAEQRSQKHDGHHFVVVWACTVTMPTLVVVWWWWYRGGGGGPGGSVCVCVAGLGERGGEGGGREGVWGGHISGAGRWPMACPSPV